MVVSRVLCRLSSTGSANLKAVAVWVVKGRNSICSLSRRRIGAGAYSFLSSDVHQLTREAGAVEQQPRRRRSRPLPRRHQHIHQRRGCPPACFPALALFPNSLFLSAAAVFRSKVSITIIRRCPPLILSEMLFSIPQSLRPDLCLPGYGLTFHQMSPCQTPPRPPLTRLAQPQAPSREEQPISPCSSIPNLLQTTPLPHLVPLSSRPQLLEAQLICLIYFTRIRSKTSSVTQPRCVGGPVQIPRTTLTSLRFHPTRL